ncbi:hypothetical protein COHA_009790 [Chlorella ohadii]|uniref:FAS1 domain-containing protein n=1 Tax=Chlorella ohadii TaxID=2649997 RepID=A0AAD5GXI7_9CHLO|nr:hypothetical protein COHA_009790 [Chlorella ohadii]
MQKALLPIALLLMLAAPATVSARELQAVKPPQFAASLYDALVIARFDSFRALVDAAGLKAYLSNPKLQATLLAPDEGAFATLFADCSKAGVSALVQYHIMTQPVRVALDANWPTPPQPFRQIPTASPTKMKLRFFENRWEAHGTGRDAFVRPGGANFACGAGLLHVMDNVITFKP